MFISIKNAYANNLKNISVDIPLGEITALTGVSGSGKSTLLRDIIGAYGALNYTCIAPKTVKDALLLKKNVEVDLIKNLPVPILIDVRSTITNPASTVSTVSGIHEILRNLFVGYGKIYCEKCGSIVSRNYSIIKNLCVDLRIETINDAIVFIENQGSIKRIDYFDKNGIITTNEKKKVLATVYFSFNKITEKIIMNFNKLFNCTVKVISDSANITYDFVKEIECDFCNSIGLNLIRNRFSYNTIYEEKGGGCRCCNGSGILTKIKLANLFQNTEKGILEGATRFVTPKGIKYTTITEKLIYALYKKLNIDIQTPINELSESDLEIILYGYNQEISFSDRIGGKKIVVYEGLANYLDFAYKTHKGGDLLGELFEEISCPKCNGSRFDRDIKRFVFCGETINSLMGMSLDELGKWCKKILKDTPRKARKYIEKIIKETDNFNLLSCGHLTLNRSCNTLSGGELQRIRLCALFNANIHGLCYLLDEPSSGLHYGDIENLAILLRKICTQGNTIIIVEHNKKLLSICDYIVDIGPLGGNQGGNILFSSPVSDILKYDSATATVIKEATQHTQILNKKPISFNGFISFEHLTYNNLKNVSIKFPRNAYTAVCGISGSGKSTFVKKAVYSSIKVNLEKYGFEGLLYLNQTTKVTTSLSTILSLIKMGDYISKIFEKSSKFKVGPSNFSLRSTEGKCKYCGGQGKLYSINDEFLGICEHCKGYGFLTEVLNIRVDGLNIFEFLNTNFEDLKNIVTDDKIKKVAELSCQLGVGYLSFSRQSKTLSKGELQRISLIDVLLRKGKNQLLILDEPSKGLHTVDISSLIFSLREITQNGNTVLIVEHNPEMIRNADYIIELGGTGPSGGYLLYQGNPDEITDTPTAKMLSGIKLINKSSTVKDNKIIKVENNGKVLKYEPFQVYYDSINSEALLKAAKRSRDDFLSVAIPNNSMFSKLDKNLIDSDTPIMMVVDFSEKLKYNISICEALGLKHFICSEAVTENSEPIANYVFDITSTTGKCTTCSGLGKTFAIEESFFVENGDLTAACKKFLKNSTYFLKLAKSLKKDNIDITKNISEMRKNEKNILFWGIDNLYEIDGDYRRWEGIIQSFMHLHKYYPSKDADILFKNKKEIKCPSCKGKRLSAAFINYKCCDLTYDEWMSLPIEELLGRLNKSCDERMQVVKERLRLLNKIGLDKILLASELVSLNEISAAKIKLLSLFFNKIYNIGIIVNKIELVDITEQKIIKSILTDLAKINTVWIL